MLTRLLNRVVVCFVLCGLLITISTSAAAVNKSTKRRSCLSPEKKLLDVLELAEDVDDSEIIKLLDIPGKRILATALIRYRRISSATPKLLRIVNDNKTIFPAKITAAKALCDFGNKEWIPTIKALLTDPNSVVGRHIPQKIKVAGLLARAGDYSQFQVVATSINDGKNYIRSFAIQALGKFGHKTKPVTDSAVELLTSVATSDSIPWLRERAIDALEKIAKKKPEVTAKIIDALEANIDSPDKSLRIVCRVKLTMYDRKLKTD